MRSPASSLASERAEDRGTLEIAGEARWGAASVDGVADGGTDDWGASVTASDASGERDADGDGVSPSPPTNSQSFSL